MVDACLETILGIVDAGKCEAADVARPHESVRQALHLSTLWTFAVSSCSGPLRGRENGREDLKMAVSLGFWHFQPMT